MKNKFMYFLLVFVMLFAYVNVVSAENSSQYAVKGIQSDTLYNSLKASYEEGIPSITVSTANQEIIVYGHSVCTTSGCEYTYQGVESSDLEELLASAITCADGSTSIDYTAGVLTTDAYKASTYHDDHDVYWSEVYSVTCSSEGSLGIDDIDETDDYSDTDDSDDYSDSSSSSSSSGSTEGTYGSSTSEDNVDTGVETYYIILIVVALVSYGLMKIVKKYNLFKSI